MKFFFKIEDLLNKGIEFCINLLKVIFKKLIPQVIINKFNHIISKPVSQYQKIKKFIYLKLQTTKSFIIKLPPNIIKLIKDHAQINTIYKIKDQINQENIIELISKIKNYYQSKNKKYIYGSLFITILIVASTIYFIRIHNLKEELSSIEMAENNIHKVPQYLKTLDKQILTEAIKIPLLVKRKKYSSLELSFVAEASNYFILIFFKKYEYRIKDHLYTTIAPTLLDFIFTEEGKNIVAQKIKNEINFLLKQYNIRGHIRSVYIIEIVKG